MAHLELRKFVRATPEQVWDVLANIEGQYDWMVDLRSLQFTTAAHSGTGAEMKVTSELFNLPLVKDVMQITSWQPPHRYDVRHSGSFDGTGSFIIEAVPGGSVFTWIEDFKPPLGLLGELGFKWIVGPHMSRVFKRSMENVRQLVESNRLTAEALNPQA